VTPKTIERSPRSRPVGLSFLLVVVVLLAACDVGSDPLASPLEDLQLVGVDFELNSMIITNNGEDEVRTQGLWAYRDGEAFEFDIFIIEPRSTILFSMRDLGEVSTTAGELALFDSDSFDNPQSMLQYVVWGQGVSSLSEIATEADLWPSQGTVDVPTNTVTLLRIDPAVNDPAAWEPAGDEG
jgi:hypothetical protein